MEASEGRETERMAKSAVQSAAKSLTYFIQQKDFHLSHVEESARTLRNKLNALLKDVDGMRGYNESVQLIEVANNIKNVIDSFIFKIAEQRGETSAGWMSYQSTFNSGIKDKPAIEDLGKKIFDLKTRLEDIILSNRSQYGIHNIQQSGEASTSSNQSQIKKVKRASIVEEAEVVGFEDETRTLVGRLIAGDMRRVVISITGTGGTGKTTLAKKVYDNFHVRKSFDFRYWVYVAQKYRVRDILSACMDTFCPWLLPDKPEEVMRSILSKYLEGKRYLVVIDGIWSRVAWDGLVTAFPDWKNGSRVLLTTRNEEVAEYADTQSTPHKLRSLNENESWTLFCKKALLGNPFLACLPYLEELGRRMVAKCGGLRVAIEVLGGILSRKEKSVYEWEKVLNRVEWCLREREEDTIPVILTLGYNDLPYYLKPCFLYLGAFPEICVDELIRMWISEGFVQRRGEEEMEDVAEDYIEEFISRSMIQVAERKSNGTAESCRVHDLLRDLSISKAKEGRFLDVYGNIIPTSPTTSRRLSITSGVVSKSLSLNRSTPHLRSLLHLSQESEMLEKPQLEILLGAFKLLRVIDLRQLWLFSLPDEIGHLIHLRYLCLMKTEIGRLPSTITRLCNLQTLDLRSTTMEMLPDDIWKMGQLRHLLVSSVTNIINTEQQCRISDHTPLHRLSNLQTLSIVEAGSWIEDGLEKMTNLRELGIHGDLKMGLSCSVFKLVHLRSLWLMQTSSQCSIPAFASFSNHQHLYKMNLTGCLEKLLELHEFPPNLTELCLYGSELEQDPMGTLEMLPNLRILRLHPDAYTGKEAYMGKEMVCSVGGFPLLEVLNIELGEIEVWRVEEGTMPSLRCLEIKNCRKLKMLPDGLRHLTTLQELQLMCAVPNLYERVREEGEDWFKIQHIPSLIIRH